MKKIFIDNDVIENAVQDFSKTMKEFTGDAVSVTIKTFLIISQKNTGITLESLKDKTFERIEEICDEFLTSQYSKKFGEANPNLVKGFILFQTQVFLNKLVKQIQNIVHEEEIKEVKA